jgi:hypothetical protein
MTWLAENAPKDSEHHLGGGITKPHAWTVAAEFTNR